MTFRISVRWDEDLIWRHFFFFFACTSSPLVWKTPGRKTISLLIEHCSNLLCSDNWPPYGCIFQMAGFLWILCVLRGPDQWSRINACALNSVLRHIGNPCRSRPRPPLRSQEWPPPCHASNSPFLPPPTPLPPRPASLVITLHDKPNKCLCTFIHFWHFAPATAATRKKTDEGGIDILIARVNLLNLINIPDSPSQDYCSYTYGDNRIWKKKWGTQEARQCAYGYVAEMHFTTFNVEGKKKQTKHRRLLSLPSCHSPIQTYHKHTHAHNTVGGAPTTHTSLTFRHFFFFKYNI